MSFPGMVMTPFKWVMLGYCIGHLVCQFHFWLKRREQTENQRRLAEFWRDPEEFVERRYKK